jgi:hypothetical protein
MAHKVPVPYKSQYLHIEDKTYALTACGMTCLYMVLEFFATQKETKSPKNLEVMIVEARHNPDAYLEGIGWKHDFFVKLAQEHGLQSFRKEKMEDLNLIKTYLSMGFPVIISVERRCLSVVSYHMVVLTGYQKDEHDNVVFTYNEPASLEQEKAEHRQCTEEEVLHFWRKKAIFFHV